ncbi:MAG: hypothetical protein ACYTEQ_09560 [Planctomycetota bacterium]|jgi:hypothetical protein
MSIKGGNFFEEHVEKMVLAVVGFACVCLLIFRVFISPNKVSYGSREYSPSSIDNHIGDQAEALEEKLRNLLSESRDYKPRLGEFAARIESAINVDRRLVVPVPPPVSITLVGDRKYSIPAIGGVEEVAAEHIRVAAYVPIVDVDEENEYAQANSEPNDIDLVTVEAKFDAAALCSNFYESFASEDVPREWRDPCLARPVFAAVQLQRQLLLPGGTWTNWQDVPRTRIDLCKKMFEVVEDVEDLPAGGVRVRMLQFERMRVVIDLLQPEPYRIASAEEEWFPPLLHEKYVKYQKKVEAEERRQAKEEERSEQERRREGRDRGRYGDWESGRRADREMGVYGDRRRYGERDRGRYGERDRGRYPEQMGRDRESRARGRHAGGYGRTRTSLRGVRDERRMREEMGASGGKGPSKAPAMADFYKELKQIQITRQTNIFDMREPLVLWAHDDTVKPGSSYRYRIRLGVFNPIAGTNQFNEQDLALKNDAILWSEYSEVTNAVEVPERLYFFPLNIQEAARVATVKVSKYVLGYWYAENFFVQQGEVIGRVRENKHLKDEEDETEKLTEDIALPERVDYTTGAVLVDFATVSDWSVGGGREPRARPYSDMLYSFDGVGIEHIPIKMNYWPKELQVKFAELKKLEDRPRKAFRAWGTKADRGRIGGRRDELSREERERERAERFE